MNSKWQVQKWRKALQKYCDDQANLVGGDTGYCACGNMTYCLFCESSANTNACVRAIKKLAEYRDIKIDYNNYDFKSLIERVERR